LAKCAIEDLVASFHSFFAGCHRISGKERINPRRRFDDVLTSNLKETLIALPYEERSAFLSRALGNSGESEADLAEKLFLSEEQIREMADGGMEIGGHGDRHLSLETLDRASQAEDIARGTAVLCKVLGSPPRIFSYPHGRSNADSVDVLKTQGYALAVSIRPEAVRPDAHPFAIPRFDTNDIRSTAL